jgi:hypothetical protein
MATAARVYEQFREICLSFPETSEVFVESWGHPTFRVGPNERYCLNAPKRLAKQIARG